MTDASRRNFLTLAGAGIAAAGVAAAVPAVTASAAPAAAAPTALPRSASGSLAAFVHDVHTGEVAVMVEGREVVVTDHELVARLAHAIATAGL